MGSDWVQPRASGRWTTVGLIDAPDRAFVDPAGLVTLVGATWSLDWWVGAEDRWHLPSQEVAVRQALVGSSPVVETRLRVPSGDAVHRAYGARSAGGDAAVVVEVENQSKVPFAVALAVRPHDQLGTGGIGAIAVGSPHVLVDGSPAVVLPRSPGRLALSDATRDAAAVVQAGEAALVGARSRSIRCPDGLANAALLFPVAHTATLRVVLPLESGPVEEPAAFPGAAHVASGWAAHAGAGARLELPDRRLRDAVAASTRHLLLAAGGSDEAAALDRLGFHAEAAELLVGDPLVAHRHDPPAHLAAVARHWVLTRDPAFARAAVALTGALVARAGAAVDPETLADLAELLEAAAEPRAAADLRAVAVPPGGVPVVGADPTTHLERLLRTSNGTWTWPGTTGAGEPVGHDLRANAELVGAVVDQLVAERPGGLALAPSVPDPWLGQGWEVHDLPTRRGTLSYAVRWHGDRPALLWELARRPADPPTTLTAPGLDPSWSTVEPVGEALLAPVPVPERGPRRGLTIPVSIEPGRRS
jgi:hypothetical protein